MLIGVGLTFAFLGMAELRENGHLTTAQKYILAGMIIAIIAWY